MSDKPPAVGGMGQGGEMVTLMIAFALGILVKMPIDDTREIGRLNDSLRNM